MKKIVYFSFLLFLFISCSTNSKSSIEEVSSAVAAEDQTEAEIRQIQNEIEQEEKLREATTTSMTFDKMTHNFGTIKEDSENKASFTVTNTGKNPLIIEKVDVSCGCTTAKKPEKPIAPGKKDVIEVVFHPKVGQLDEQKKTVTITANTDPEMEVLNIEAFVVKK